MNTHDSLTNSRVVKKLVLRAWLMFMFSVAVGIGLGTTILSEAAFITFPSVGAFFLLCSLWYKRRLERGIFGNDKSEVTLVNKYLWEESHWWGKPIF